MSALTVIRKPATDADLDKLITELVGLTLSGKQIADLLFEMHEASANSAWNQYSSLSLVALAQQIESESKPLIQHIESVRKTA